MLFGGRKEVSIVVLCVLFRYLTSLNWNSKFIYWKLICSYNISFLLLQYESSYK